MGEQAANKDELWMRYQMSRHTKIAYVGSDSF